MGASGSTLVTSSGVPRVLSAAGRAKLGRFAGRARVRYPDYVSNRAAIVEVASYRDRQHATRGVTAVEVLELGPARDETRLDTVGVGRVVIGGAPSEADERRNSRSCGSQDFLGGWDLFDVDTWCCISGHSPLPLWSVTLWRRPPTGSPADQGIRVVPQGETIEQILRRLPEQKEQIGRSRQARTPCNLRHVDLAFVSFSLKVDGSEVGATGGLRASAQPSTRPGRRV